MTRMIPETIHSSVQSTAEKRIFEVIRDAPNTDRWVCLHSLGLAQHDTKRRVEIDFVLLTHRVAYVGMSRARTRLHVVIHEDCDKMRRERKEERRGRVDSDVEMLL